MSRYLRGTALAALTVAAACALSTAASAQSYNRLVVFGDSLSDNGNLFAATGGTQPPSPPYFQGRFSTGPVFTELLGFNAGRFTAGAPVNGSVNYAFGGARTDSSASPPGMRLQLASYQGAGGVFGASDLVSILGGANNIFQAIPTAGVSSNPTGAIAPVALGAAADINFIVSSVASGGAGTILVTNLPKLSTTPQFNSGPGAPAAPLADFAVGQFNSALSAGLFATAAAQPNTNIILMDLFKVGDVIVANPGAFGITNVRDACLNPVTFQVCSTPDTFFYLDGVHPTAAGHRLIARLANDYLYYGDIGAASTLLGETAYRHREDGLEAATERFSGREAWEAGTSITVSGGYDRTETDARGTVSEAESEGYGARMALESGNETWRVGLAGSFRDASVDTATTSFELQSIGLDVYGGWRSGNLFVNAAAGVAGDDYDDVDRLTSLAPIRHTAATKGYSTGGRLQAGVWFDAGGIALSPRAAVTYVNSDVDAYIERGAAAAYSYADREVKGTTGEVALRAETTMGAFGVFVEGGYRDSLDDSSDAVRIGIASSPSRILSREVEEPFGGQALASAGFSGLIGERLKVDVGYRGRFGDKADSHMGAITLTLPL